MTAASILAVATSAQLRGEVGTGAKLALIAALAVLIRVPFNGNVGVDEAYYLVVGRQWLDGVPPYVGALDVKPPLLFLLMALAETLFGPTIFAAKALAGAAAALTACGLFLLGRRFFGELAGFAAALLYSLASLNLGGSFSPAELIMAPFTTFAVLFGLSPAVDGGKRRFFSFFLPGLLFGAAASIKQTAIFEVAALGIWLAWGYRGTFRFHALAAFAAGLAAVPLAFAAYYLALGHLGALFDNAVIAALFRMRIGYIPWSEAFVRLGCDFILILPVAAMAGLVWAARRQLADPRAHAAAQFLALWAAFSMLGVLAARALLDFYALTILPPLCLWAALFLDRGLGRIRERLRRWIWRGVALGCSIFFFASSLSALYLSSGDLLPASDEAARAMRKAGLKSGDRIFAFDRDVIVYLAAGAEPPGRVFHPLQLQCEFPLPGAQSAVADALARDPAFIVLAEPPIRLSCEVPDRRELVERKLVSDYCLLGRFGSTLLRNLPGGFLVYGRRNRIIESGITCSLATFGHPAANQNADGQSNSNYN